jgi:hypothetical protein
VKVVPRPERLFLALDDQETRAREHEESLLVVLAVVHRHRLARLKDVEVDPELPERPLALEVAGCAERAIIAPARLARVDDEPALAVVNKAVLRRAERQLGQS